MNGRDRLRRTLFERIKRADAADLPALTALRARAFLATFPTYGLAWLYLGDALGSLARYDEAEAAFHKAIEFAPARERVFLFIRVGDVVARAGDPDRAADWFRKAIEAGPDDCIGRIYLGGLLARQGRLAEAEEIHRAGTRCRDGDIDEAFLNLGLVLRAQGRYEEAADCFTEAIDRDPDYRDARRALHDVMACLREKGAAPGRTPPGPPTP